MPRENLLTSAKLFLKWLNKILPASFQFPRDTLMFLLQQSMFVINIMKSFQQTVHEIKLLGLQINFLDMTFTLQQEKVVGLIIFCPEFLQNKSESFWELTNLIGNLCSTTEAVLSAFTFKYRHRQWSQDALTSL